MAQQAVEILDLVAAERPTQPIHPRGAHSLGIQRQPSIAATTSTRKAVPEE